MELQYIDLIECNLTKFDYRQIVDANYIIHCAAPTASKFFIDHPVETFDFIYTVSHTLLKYASSCSIKSFVYLSSLEVYGEIHDDSIYVTEDTQGYLDIMSVRSCYPMAKRAVENLCILYANQYQVPVKIARLTQTTGTGIAKNDNRVIAQFSRLAAQKKDIILHSDGNAARPYCYITDAVSAILYILLKGNNGEAYNIANEDTYISVREMANFLRNYFAPSIKVKFELNENLGYAPLTKLRLSANKLKCLGWKPHFQLYDIFARLIAYYQCES